MKDGIQIGVYKINQEKITDFSRFISVKVEKILRNSQAQFWEKLRKLKLRQNHGCLMKMCKLCCEHHHKSFYKIYLIFAFYCACVVLSFLDYF